MIRFVILLTFLLIFESCAKETQEKLIFKSEIRSVELETLDQDISTFWHYAFNTYTMEVVCGCSCSDIELIPVIWENGKHLLPPFINQEVANSAFSECGAIRDVFKRKCLHESGDQFVNETINSIDSFTFIPETERTFIRNFIISVKNNSLNKETIISEWENLPYNAKTRNHISLLYVQVGLSILKFHEDNPGLFGENEDVDALVNHLAGALIGGVGGMIMDCVEDLYSDTGYGSGGWGDLGRSFVKGAVWGAVGAA